MLGRKHAFLASTALVASFALSGCFLDGGANPAAPLEDPPVLGVFGLEVGVPVNLISATRGDGVSFDKYAVTFNNEDGTSVTITLADGEEVTFTEADLEWVTDLYGRPRISLSSDDGDQLEFVLGTIELPVDCDGEGCNDVPVYAVGRIDEANSWDGFETYGVVGAETDPGALPRTAIVEGEGGELIEGHADYDGVFVASVYVDGEIVSDDVNGSAWVDIDFANNIVEFDAKGSYGWGYDVELSGEGDAVGDLTFEETVVYSGDLDGEVEIRVGWFDSEDVYVEGEFAGAVYGPGGEPGDDVEDAIAATATAGVFEASSEDNEVMIVGGFGSDEGEWREDGLAEE